MPLMFFSINTCGLIECILGAVSTSSKCMQVDWKSTGVRSHKEATAGKAHRMMRCQLFQMLYAAHSLIGHTERPGLCHMVGCHSILLDSSQESACCARNAAINCLTAW